MLGGSLSLDATMLHISFAKCRISTGIDAGAWYHEHFLRGCPGEIRRMIRIKIKGRTAPKNPPDGGEEPNFYAMPPVVSPGCGKQRVSVETNLTGDGLPFHHDAATDLKWRVLPEPALSRHVLLNPGPLPVLPNLFQHRYGEILDGEWCAPSTNRLNQDGPFANRLFASSGVLGKKLSRRSKSPTFPINDDEAKSLLAAGIKPLPLGPSFTNPSPVGVSPAVIPSDTELLTAGGLEPLPFEHRTPPLGAGRTSSVTGTMIESSPLSTSSASIPSDDEEKRRLTAGLEPLPFGRELPVDDFADYIDSTIQML